MTAAVALAHAQFSVALVEKNPISYAQPAVDNNGEPMKWFALGQDVLSWMAAWGWVFSHHPLTNVQLSCHDPQLGAPFPDTILLTANDIGAPSLAGVISQHTLDSVMKSSLQSCVDVYAPDSIVEWEETIDGWSVLLSSGICLRAPAVIGADGKHSSTRQRLDPLHLSYRFPQTATVFQATGIPEGWAYEHFFPHGSLALLSTHKDHNGDHGVGIWIHDAPLTTIEQVHAVSPVAVTPVGRWSHFPVEGLWTEKPSKSRCVLVGNAAHIIHPIAGQGLNLGLRHVKGLVEYMVQRKQLGLDWGLGWNDLHTQWATQALSLHMGTAAVYALLCGAQAGMWWRLSTLALSFPWMRKGLLELAGGQSMWHGLWSFFYQDIEPNFAWNTHNKHLPPSVFVPPLATPHSDSTSPNDKDSV